MRPAVGSVTEELYAALTELAHQDEKYSWALLHFSEAIAGRAQEIDDLVRDTEAGPGWSSIMDIDRVPPKALGWLSQFVGVRLLTGLTVTQQKARTKDTSGFARGKVQTIVDAAKQTLIGAKAVQVRERDGSAYRFTIITYTSQTPNPAATFAAMLEKKPGGLIMTHNVMPGQDYLLVRTNFATYQAVKDGHANYQVLRDSL